MSKAETQATKRLYKQGAITATSEEQAREAAVRVVGWSTVTPGHDWNIIRVEVTALPRHPMSQLDNDQTMFGYQVVIESDGFKTRLNSDRIGMTPEWQDLL